MARTNSCMLGRKAHLCVMNCITISQSTGLNQYNRLTGLNQCVKDTNYTGPAQDVDNVYTQHTPLLTATLTRLSNDKLEPLSYPYMAGSQVRFPFADHLFID